MERVKSPTSVTVYVAVCIMGISGWLPMRVLWVELPVLKKLAPEGGSLPMYFLVLMETTTLATVAYLLARKCCTPRLSEVPVIYSSLALGATSLILLGCFWEHTTPIRGEPHSFMLLVSALLAALVASVATVTYIPFTARLNPQYMTAILLGETLASLIPHLMLLAQGGGRGPPCELLTTMTPNFSIVVETDDSAMHNFMRSTTTPPEIPTPLRFTVGVYFFIHAAVVVLSALCFTALRWSRRCRLEYRQQPHQDVAGEAGSEVNLGRNEDIDDTWRTECDGAAYMLDDGSYSQTRLYHQQQKMGNCDTELTCSPGQQAAGSHNQPQQHAKLRSHAYNSNPAVATAATNQVSLAPHHNTIIYSADVDTPAMPVMPRAQFPRPKSFKVLLTITLWTSAIMFGPLSSIITCACYPTGNNAFLLGALITDATALMACVVAARCMSSGRSQVTIVIALTCLGTILLTYFVALITFSHQTQSHNSPLFGSAGELLATVAWVAIIGLFSFARMAIGVESGEASAEAVMWYSCLMRLGAVLGGLSVIKDIGICKVYRVIDQCKEE